MEKEIKRLEKELAECKKEKDEYLNGWKRAKADYANYKKEESERISRIIDYREDEIILNFISIVDSFDNALIQICH
jgi:molecular chaperone GrpE